MNVKDDRKSFGLSSVSCEGVQYNITGE